MVTLEAFRQLESVLGSSTVAINEKKYGSVVIGESFVFLFTYVRSHTIQITCCLRILAALMMCWRRLLVAA
jgi:hypothetical protein